MRRRSDMYLRVVERLDAKETICFLITALFSSSHISRVVRRACESLPAAAMARKRWDSSIHNLELYRATKLERERRRQSHQSQNAEAARKDLQARRLGRFSNILNALDKPRPKRPDEADAEEGAGERHAPSSAPSRDDASASGAAADSDRPADGLASLEAALEEVMEEAGRRRPASVGRASATRAKRGGRARRPVALPPRAGPCDERTAALMARLADCLREAEARRAEQARLYEAAQEEVARCRAELEERLRGEVAALRAEHEAAERRHQAELRAATVSSLRLRAAAAPPSPVHLPGPAPPPPPFTRTAPPSQERLASLEASRSEAPPAQISDRSRTDLGQISDRSRTDLGQISGGARTELGQMWAKLLLLLPRGAPAQPPLRPSRAWPRASRGGGRQGRGARGRPGGGGAARLATLGASGGEALHAPRAPRVGGQPPRAGRTQPRRRAA